MKSLAWSCLVGVLAVPIVMSAQTPTPPSVGAQTPTPPAQGRQTPSPAGRAGRGTVTPTEPGTEVPPGRGTVWAGRGYDAPSLQNVRIDLTLTDTYVAEAPSKKTLTMIVVDGNSGAIRSTSGPLTLNVDASPHIRPDGRIYVNLSLQYYPARENTPGAAARGEPAVLNESLAVLLSDGKPLTVSQSADPRNDRKVTVEVTATIVK